MRYFFLGIKGSGMSALACIMHDLGYEVLGSDKPEHFFTEEELNKRNIKILNFNKNNIKKDMIIIKGNAFGEENEEVKEAIKENLKIYTYQEMVDTITREYKLIAVSGCHGKTTVSTMMSKVLEPLGVSYLIGDGRGYASSNNDYFVLEACEYKRHFLEYHPYYSIITNVELDHIDYYKDLPDVIDAFTEFANKAQKCVIACGDDENVKKIKTSKKIIYYGFNENNDVRIKNIVYGKNISKAEVFINNKYYDTFVFPFTADHLILNALSVITVCYLENIDKEIVKSQMLRIIPAKRRFIEEKFKGNILVDDYAHHPTEVRVTIAHARKKYPNKDIIAIFMPHTKSRVKFFKQDFANALNLADYSYVMNIAEDRVETGFDDVSSKLL